MRLSLLLLRPLLPLLLLLLLLVGEQRGVHGQINPMLRAETPSELLHLLVSEPASCLTSSVPFCRVDDRNGALLVRRTAP